MVAALAIGASLFVFSSGDDDDSSSATSAPDATNSPTTLFTADPSKTYAYITTNYGEIVVELDVENAPNAAAHFVELAKRGFYDELTWHRAAADFVIQGGDPKGDGTGGSGESIVGEVPTDHYPLGALAAAKATNDPPGTFDSQFFIVTGTRGLTLPNDYARFGRVVQGLEVAQQIEHLAPAEGDGKPSQEATIDKVEIVEPGGSETSETSTSDTTTETTVATPTPSG
jgi:cyclophilin family peptidyl-prolyl cis-trans isomerase